MPRILLVDDDIAEISAVKRVLARAGHQPALATNASDAQVAVDHERPDLLLVSSTCEGGDALGLARRLAEDPATAGIPLIVLGEAASLPESARRLARPVDPEQLTAEVTAALGDAGIAPAEAPAPGARATALGRLKPGKAPPPPPPGQRPAQAGLRDAAAARRAAAEALRARAEELRRSPPRAQAAAAAAPAVPPPARPSLSAPILLPPLPERTVAPRPPAAAPAPAAAPPQPAPELDLEDGQLEAALRRASTAADEAPDGALPTGALEVAADQDARHRAADEALRALEAEAQARPDRQAEERALQQAIETARREAFETARRELEERARHEAAEAARRLESEARARREEVEELSRREAEETRRRGEAEAQAQAEAEARHHAEKELAALRAQREAERREAEQQVAAVKERAAAEGQAAEELRRLAEEEVRRRDQAASERGAEEERLRAAIASARAELDELRERNAEEVRRRGEAEESLRKLADAARREAERREAEEREAAERQAEAAAAPRAGPESAAYTPPPFFGPFEDPQAHAGEREAAEGAARRRVAALRTAPAEPPPPPDGAAPPQRAPAPLAALPADGGDFLAALAPPEALEEPARLLVQPPAQLRGGNLAELPAPRLLALAARARASGRFDFEGEVARSIWLEDGQVVGASSADPAERLEEVALRLGLVTRDQHRQIAQSAAALPARRAALLLLERGFLKPTELTGLVRRRTEEVVFGVFADPEAIFRWVAAEVPPEERIALSRGALALAVEGVRRRWLAPRVDALLGGPGTLLVPVAGGPAPAELGLSAEERRAVALADGLRTLDEISQASPLDPLSTRQALAALVLCGALTVRLLQAGRPAGQAAAAIDLARVKDKLDQVRRADYFTVLGVSRLCTPHEVREAADRLRAEFEPRRFAGLADDGLPARLAEILQVVEDARAVLADDRLRDEYLRGLG